MFVGKAKKIDGLIYFKFHVWNLEIDKAKRLKILNASRGDLDPYAPALIDFLTNSKPFEILIGVSALCKTGAKQPVNASGRNCWCAAANCFSKRAAE